MARLASSGDSPVRKRLMSSIVPLRATPVPDAVAQQKNGLAKCRIVSVPIVMKLFVHETADQEPVTFRILLAELHAPPSQQVAASLAACAGRRVAACGRCGRT